MNPLDERRLCYHVQCLLSQLAFHAWLYTAVFVHGAMPMQLFVSVGSLLDAC